MNRTRNARRKAEDEDYLPNRNPITGYHRVTASSSNTWNRPRLFPTPVITYICFLVIVTITGIFLYFVPRYIIKSIRPEVLQIGVLNASAAGVTINDDDTLVTGEWAFNFYIKNPNNWTVIHYDNVQFALAYRNNYFFTSSLAVLEDQEKGSYRLQSAGFTVVVNDLDPMDQYPYNIVKIFAEDFRTGAVNFTFTVIADITFKTWLVQQPRRVFSACANMTFIFNSDTGDGRFDGTQVSCRARMLRFVTSFDPS